MAVSEKSDGLRYGVAFGVLVLTTLAALAQPAPGRGGGGRGAIAPATPALSEEYLLLGDATRGAGEPMVAIDPTDPKNIVAVAMGNLFNLKSSVRSFELPRSTIAWLAVSHDAGLSWKIGELPIMRDDLVRCSDAFVDVTQDGRFLAGCMDMQVAVPRFGAAALVVSYDRGDSWGPPVNTISSLSVDKYAPGLKPRIIGAEPFDRPFTSIDDSAGIVYVEARGGQAEVGASPGQFRPQSYITASTDGGKSFGTIYSWDSKDYPQSLRGISTTAGHGEAAVVYIASKAPAKEKTSCPCAVMGITKDMGKTFAYHVLKNFTPVPAPGAQGAGPGGRGPGGPNAGTEGLGRGGANAGGGGGSPSGGLAALSADFTKEGRYAILKYGVQNGRPMFWVTVSEDHGQTWSPFVTAATSTDATAFDRQVDFKFGRNGLLAMAWRAVYADGSYDLWTAISKDGGHSFSDPYRVSRAKSPSNIPHGTTAQNDDVASLSMSNENLYVVWGDQRAGFLGTWFGRVALSAYKFQ